jgi:DNA-directed RNA polymerase subunit RPC12/RpoP
MSTKGKVVDLHSQRYQERVGLLVPLAASRDHPCIACGARVTLTATATRGLNAWECARCGYRPVQWWPLGRRDPLIGRPFRVSSLDRPNPRLLGHSDGRESGASPMAEEYRRDTEWIERERTRFDRAPVHFT